MRKFNTVILITMIIVMTAFSQERKEIGNLVIEGVPDIPETLVEKMRQYQNTRSASMRDWLSDDGSILISTRFAETSQLHVIKKPGGVRQQITFFNEPVRGGSVCPTNAHSGFLYTRDVGGTENHQIYFYNLDDGSSKRLTDGDSRNGGALWSNSGKKIAYFSNKMNKKDWHVYITSVNNKS